MKNIHACDAADCLNTVMINLDQAAIHLIMGDIPVLQEFKQLHELAQEVFNIVEAQARGN